MPVKKPKQSTDEIVYVRLSEELKTIVKAKQEKMQILNHGMTVSRSDAIRVLLFEARDAEKAAAQK